MKPSASPAPYSNDDVCANGYSTARHKRWLGSGMCMYVYNSHNIEREKEPCYIF